MKTAISIPDSIFRSADSFAKRHGLSRSELYATAVAEFLSRRRGKQITSKLDSVYEEIDSSLDSRVAELQSRSIQDKNW
jgi:metal-responsive CopG/Arc/MetJ family transcriptional regulator